MRLHISAIAGIALFAATPVSAQVITIATSEQGSLAYAAAAAIAKEAAKISKLKFRVTTMGSPTTVLPLVDKGSVDMTISIAVTPAFARRGEQMFAGKKLENLRTIGSMFAMSAAFMVRADSGIKTLADLKGKRVTSDLRQQKIVEIFSEAGLAAGGLSWKDVKGVPAPTGIKGVEDFMAGKVDAVLWSMSSGKSHQAHTAVKGIRWLPMESTPAAMAAMKKYAPGAHVEMLKPSKRYPAVDKPLPAITAPLVMVGSTKTPPEAAMVVARVLREHQKALAAGFRPFGGLDPDKVAIDVAVPYHPAAAAYYKKAGVAK